MLAPDDREGGLTLAQYATVRAAVAEPFPLEDVLGTEGIDAPAWSEADVLWTLRIATDGAALAAYTIALADAEDRLARKVEPVDADLEAWMGLLALFGATGDAGPLLREQGLGTNDLARLSRGWQRRLERDDGLVKRAAAIARRGPRPLPPLQLGPRRLTASPHARAAAPAAAESAPASLPASARADLPMALDRYAALSAELSTAGRDTAPVLARYGISAAARASLDQAFRERLLRDPAMAADFARLRDHQLARIAARAAAADAPPGSWRSRPRPPPEPPPAPRHDGRGTATGAAAGAPALPFGSDRSPAYAAALAGSPPAAPGAGSDGTTVIAMSPFAQAAAPGGDDAPTVQRPSPLGGKKPLAPRGGGSAFGSPLAPKPLPFEPNALHSDHGTAPAVPSPLASKPLPFSPSATPVLPSQVAPKPERIESGTATDVVSPFARAVMPFASRPGAGSVPPAHAPSGPPRAAPPAPGAASPEARAPDAPATAGPTGPPMPMEHHAALCVECAVHPARAADALARYGVDAARKEQADRWWKAQAARDPAIRAAWTRAFDAYHAQLTRRR